MSATDTSPAAAAPDAMRARARTLGWVVLLFGALGLADAVRFARAALWHRPLVVGDWVNLVFAIVLLAAAAAYLRQRRQLLAAAQRAARASNTGRPST